jgi:hypothetical protein
MKLWGFDGAIVVNLFAWRSTDPKVLARVADPIGERNNFEIVGAARECQQIVCAWGNHGSLLSRDLDVLALLRANCKDTPIRCLGVNRNGSPEHPARVPYDAQLCPLLL